MHFYTYDEWAANAYYSIDAREIPIGGQRTNNVSTDSAVDTSLINIYSCWKDPEFNSTYSGGQPVITPEMSSIDCDIGCLYKLKDGTIGCLQSLDAKDATEYGSMYKLLGPVDTLNPPYMHVNVLTFNDSFYGVKYKYIALNQDQRSYIDQVVIFQSIYSGAISFQEMSGFVNFQFHNIRPHSPGNNPVVLDNYVYKIKTNLRSNDSQMLVVAKLTFDTSNNSDYITIENISKFIYGQQDLNQFINWDEDEVQLLWKQFVPPKSAKVMPDSIMHKAKE